jgi:hypothetical protein
MARKAQTTSRILNALPPKGWAKVPAPLFHAVELVDVPGSFICQARGDGQWTAPELLAWAVGECVEVALVEWVRPALHNVIMQQGVSTVLQNETMGLDPVNVDISGGAVANKRATP